MRALLKDAQDIKEVETDVQGGSPRVIHEKQKALKLSIKEGAAASVSEGVGTNGISLFALALNASPFQVGILSSLAGLAPPVTQIVGSKLMASHSRKSIVTKFVLIQAFLWLPIATLAILFWKGFFQGYLATVLIILYALLVAVGGLAVPAWFSWMGDLVPEKDRGKYFSVRNRAVGVISILVTLTAALILDLFETKGLLLIAFFSLFILAFTFRLVSLGFLKKQYAPPIKISKKSYFSFWAFLKRFDNYGKFSLYLALLNFAIMIASPFFVVYMRQELQFSYLTLVLIATSGSVLYLLFSPLAGKFSDRFGNVKLLYIANIAFVLSSALWLFSQEKLYLLLVPQLAAGIGNAALILATTNFTYSSVKPEHRGICVAYTNLMVGIGIFAGSLLGGLLLKFLPHTLFSLNAFFIVFIAGSLARLLVGLFFLPTLKDKQLVSPLPPLPAKISLVHPFRTLHAEIGWFKQAFK